MDKGLLFSIGPLPLVNIVGILGYPCRVYLSEVAVLGLVGSRLSDIVKAGPQKLPTGIGRIPVPGNAILLVRSPPAGGAVAEV